MKFLGLFFLIAVHSISSSNGQCTPSVTTVSGSKSPTSICSGDLIFHDDFSEFNLMNWQHEITLAGGGNWEFQYYNNNRTNSFVKDGKLVIRPTFLADEHGEEFLSSGILNIHGGAPADQCTNAQFYGCERAGTPTNYLNPIKSARVRSVNSFNFRYGKLEVSAKTPLGDWLWPAFWLMPTYNDYGTWPASGEFDLLESRGNKNYFMDGENIGAEKVSSTLHFGPDWKLDPWELAFSSKNDPTTFYENFHLYQLEWTPDYIKISIDNEEQKKITPGAGGFWEFGNFSSTNMENPWKYGTKMAPFDQQFYMIINLAVGGTGGFFPDEAQNLPEKKPWSDTSSTAMRDFWNGKSQWYKTWDEEKSTFQIDYIKIWAL